MKEEFNDKSLTGFEKKLIEANAYTLFKNNPAFKEACLQTELSLISDWAATDLEQTEVREQVWMKVQLLRDILEELDRHYVDYQAPDVPDVENIH